MKKLLLVEVPDRYFPVEILLQHEDTGYMLKIYTELFTELQIPTEDEIEAYALDNILAEDSLEAFENVRKFQEGAIWMLNKIMEEK
jgi:hypothetical protein